MSRMIGLLIVSLGSFLLIAGEPAFGGKTTLLVPEPGYVPKVGDRAVLYSLDSGTIPSDLWCATTSQDCRDFLTSLFAEDEKKEGEGEPTVTVEEKLVHLAPKTEVQLVASETVEVPGAKEGPPLKCTYFAIKVLSGPFQGKTLYTLDFHITRLIEPPAGPAARAEANAPETSAPAPAPTPQPIALETPDAPPSGGGKPTVSEPPARAAAPRRIELETTEVSPGVGGEAKVPETPALAPAPRRIELETGEVSPGVGEGAKVSEPPAQASTSRRIEAQTPDAPPLPGRGMPTTVSEPPARSPASPPLALETPDTPSGVGGKAKAPETSAPAPVPAPPRIELETPVAPPLPGRGTPTTSAGAASPAPGTVTSSPEAPIGVAEPPVAAPDVDALSLSPSAPSPSPSPRGETVTEAGPGRALPAVESPPTAAVSATPRVESHEESTPVLPQAPSALPPLPPAEPSLPLAPLSEPEAKSREIRGGPSVASPATGVVPRPAPGPNPTLPSPPPALSRLEEPTSVLSRSERQTTPRKPRGLITAPASPRSAPEMLAAAKQRDAAGQAMEALVAYRTLERTHPGSAEARLAAARVKGLTEKLDIDAQELRAARVMKRARDLEASGARSLALGYFQQIVKVYPKTPTARQALERIQASGTNNRSPGR
jgi:hypothetical protein